MEIRDTSRPTTYFLCFLTLIPTPEQIFLTRKMFSKDDFFVSGEPLFIMLGITGEITGQVCVVMGADTAKDIASRMMMGMPVDALDDMAKSALSELGNMMMGNAATLLSNNNILIDITPPTLLVGSAILSSPEMAVVKVPLLYQSYEIQLSFLLKTAN